MMSETKNCIVSEMLPACHQLVAVTLLLISASAKEDCEKNTREDRCHEIFENIDNCNEVSYRPQLMDCLVTCGKCDAFTCNNPQPDTVLNCTALTSQCNSTVWERMMKEKCPSTCGKCDVKNANLCKDNSDSVVCSAMVQFCNSLDYYDAMTEQCPSTCNRCPANGQNTTCVDFAKDCASRQHLCDEPKYDGLMHRACAKTCKKCNGCYDATNKCSQWEKKGFCTNPGYDRGIVMRYCGKTCGICKAALP